MRGWLTRFLPLSFRFLESLIQDFSYSMREVRRSVGFTCVAVGSLAIGIGAVTAAFVVLDAFMIRNLPVRDPSRLVAFSTAGSASWGTWPYAFYQRARNSPNLPFDVAAASDVTNAPSPQVPGARGGTDVRVTFVSGNYFTVLGVDIARGRDLSATDNVTPSSAAVAVISDAFWTRRFGRAPDILNKTIELDGRSYEIVGVTGGRFTGHIVGHPCDVWIPLAMHPALTPDASRIPDDRSGTGRRWLKIVGRLRPAVGVDTAKAAANVTYQQFVNDKAAALGATHPEVIRERTQTVSLLTASSGFAPDRRRYGRPVVILSSLTALVFLVACANFMNLMLVRCERRRREFFIRLAIGCGRWRLIRQAATECATLALAGALLGLLFANWATVASLKQFAVLIMPVEFSFELDARVLAFTSACVVLVMAFGLWPVVRATRSTRLSIQQAADRAQLQRTFAARITVIAQLALCTVLLIGAGLLLRTVINLRFQDLGFDRNVLLVAISPRQAGYSEPAAPMLVQRIRESLSAVPGVQAVGVSGHALMDFTHYFISGTDHLTTDQNVVLPGGRWTLAAVGPGFFDAIGMSLVTGRTFDERDALPSANVVIINRSLATFVFGDQNPIGRGIRFNPRAAMLSVVGVVNDNKQVSPRDRGLGVLYLPMRDFAHVVLAVRTASSPSAAAPVIRHHLASIAGDVPVDTVHTIREVLDTAIGQERLMSAISLALATLVITIGCIGLYALMSYDVARRSRELGIRLALGATGRKMVTLVLRDAALLIVPALAIGMPLGVAVSRQLSSQLYGVDTGDPSTLTFAVVVLALVAVLAALRPARKACRIDPIFLLRHE